MRLGYSCLQIISVYFLNVDMYQGFYFVRFRLVLQPILLLLWEFVTIFMKLKEHLKFINDLRFYKTKIAIISVPLRVMNSSSGDT